MSNTTHRCNTPHVHTGFAGLGFTIAAALPCTLALALGTAANAGAYTTTYILNTPYTDSTPTATQVVVNWSTNLTSGAVQQTDLTNWSIGLYGAGNVFYTDNVIIGGTVQSNEGVARGIANVLFQFNLDTDLAGDFDNMLSGITLSSAASTAYNIYSYPTSTQGPPYSSLGLWKNGNESTRQLPGYLSVSTVAVPAPGAIALLGMAGLMGRRRR
jgi:hypothetical protein